MCPRRRIEHVQGLVPNTELAVALFLSDWNEIQSKTGSDNVSQDEGNSEEKWKKPCLIFGFTSEIYHGDLPPLVDDNL